MTVKFNILKGFLGVIYNISDAEYQERIWVKGLGPECSNFDETMCNFFDDYNAEEIVINYKDYGISQKQYKVLLNFFNILNEYSDNTPEIVNDKEVLENPEWAKIRKIAKKVLEAFYYKK